MPHRWGIERIKFGMKQVDWGVIKKPMFRVSTFRLSKQKKKDFALDATGKRKVDDNDNDNNNKRLSIISTYNILQTFFGLFQSCTQGR